MKKHLETTNDSTRMNTIIDALRAQNIAYTIEEMDDGNINRFYVDEEDLERAQAAIAGSSR